MTVRSDFIGMDDRLWTPDEWAAWLRYVESVNGKRIGVENPYETRRYKTAVNEQKYSRFVKTNTET